MRRPLDPDTQLEISLTGNAIRHAQEKTDPDTAITALREIALGRSDLLAKAGGGLLGGWLGAPGETNPNRVWAAALLILAGADPRLVTESVDQSRSNIERSGHSAS